jgi:hypothetical protein
VWAAKSGDRIIGRPWRRPLPSSGSGGAQSSTGPTFWLILLAFLAGVLRVPATILQLTGVWPMRTPRWYVVYQGVIGLVQLAVGLAMLAEYKRFGVWGKRSH